MLQPGHPAEDVSEAVSASAAWAAGGLVSTPADTNRFIRAYLAPRFFSRATQAAQLRFVPGSSQPAGPGVNASGLGVFRYRTRCGTMYGHTGNFLGYTQLAAASRGGANSVTVTATEQLTRKTHARVLAALRLPNCSPSAPRWPPASRRARSASGHLGGAAVAAAQRPFHEALEVHRGVLAGEVQVPVPPSLDAVEAGVLAGLQVGVRAADVRIA